MRIEVEGLEEKRRAFRHSYAPEALIFDDDRVRLVSPVEVSGNILPRGRGIALQGRLSATVEVDCDRCLSPVTIPVDGNIDLRYTTVQDYQSSPASEIEAADMTLSVFDGAAIDLDEAVKEQLLLAVPARTVCREDCRGLCPVCGADRNRSECQCQVNADRSQWGALAEMLDDQQP